MIAPVVLFLVSIAAVVAALILPGLQDGLLVAGPAAVASLILVLRAAARRRAPARRGAASRRWVVIDGSNVMHWKDGVPQIGTVREVVERLTSLGYAPGVVFDANAGYKISGSYQHDGALAGLLGLPEDRVFVVPKGTPADPMVLDAAKDLGARIVTNDRYRDWAEAHPEVKMPGQLIRGGYRAGQLWLDLEEPAGVGGRG